MAVMSPYLPERNGLAIEPRAARRDECADTLCLHRSRRSGVSVWGAIARAGMLAMVLAACSAQAQPQPPTMEEAQAFLGKIVALAQRGDFEALCALAGDGNCERKLDEAGRDRVPADPPVATGSEVVPPTSSSGQASAGGLVLALCGTDARGSPYASEMLVFRDGDTLRAINPAFWGGYGIGTDGQVAIESAAPTPGC